MSASNRVLLAIDLLLANLRILLTRLLLLKLPYSSCRVDIYAENPGCEDVYWFLRSKDVLTLLFLRDPTAYLLLHCCHTLLKSCHVAVYN